MERETLLDLAGGAASVAALVGYQLFLRYKLRDNPRYSLAAANRLARSAWVEHIMASGDHILAVQTLRNSTMTASFMASAAVLLIIGLLNLAAQSNALSGVWHVFGGPEHIWQPLWLGKLLALVLLLLVVFFCFTMSIRLYNHVGYLVAIPAQAAHAISPAGVAKILNQAGSYFTWGMRCYYLAVPVLCWMFGPSFMVLSTVALIAVLWRIDQAPD